jgi:hypothetical protein
MVCRHCSGSGYRCVLRHHSPGRASYRRTRHAGPVALAVAGGLLITWTRHGAYSRIVELAGFALLVAGVWW